MTMENTTTEEGNQSSMHDLLGIENPAANSHCPAPSGYVPLYMCQNCEAIYQDKVTECDCTVGESPTWIEGYAIFPSHNVEVSQD